MVTTSMHWRRWTLDRQTLLNTFTSATSSRSESFIHSLSSLCSCSSSSSVGRASSPSTLFRYSRLECGFELDQMRMIVQDSCSIVEYYPLLPRTLAVLSSIIHYYPGRLQYCRGKGLRSCHWSHLLPLSFAQVFMITMAVMTATIMLLICHKLSLKTICDLSPSPASS